MVEASDKTPEQVRQEARERVGKKVADLGGRVEGATEKVDPSVARDFAQKVGATTREAAVGATGELKRGKEDLAAALRDAKGEAEREADKVAEGFRSSGEEG